MENNILSEFMRKKDFLDFALKYNNLAAYSKEEKDNDELGLLLDTLKSQPDNMKTLSYIYSIEEFTNTLLDTLRNYHSKDMLHHIMPKLPKNQAHHQLWSIGVYSEPEWFTSIFSYNCLYGLQSLQSLGESQHSILSERKSLWLSYCLGISHAIDVNSGWFIVQIRIWHTEKNPSWGLYFITNKTIREQKFDINATLEYLSYKYPDKSLFDIFNISFDSVIQTKNG